MKNSFKSLMNTKSKIFAYIYSIIPLFLISGPFLPGTFVGVIGLYGIYQLKFYKIFKVDIVFRNFLIILSLFYLYIIVNSLISVMPEKSLKSSLFYFRFIFFTVGSYCLILNFKSIIYKSITHIILISFIIVFTSLIIEIIIGNNNTQYTGIFFDEKIVGSYIARFYPLLIGMIFYLKKDLFRLPLNTLLIIIFFISFFCVLISGERTSIIIFFISNILIFSGFKLYRKIIFTKTVLILSFILIFLINIVAKDTVDRIIFKTKSQIFEAERLNFFSAHHESHLITAFKMFEQNKIFGIGPRLFRYLCDDDKYIFNYKSEIQYSNNGSPTYIDNSPIQKKYIKKYNGCSTHPHNILIQIMAELGVVGFIFYISFLFFLFFQLIRYYKYGIQENNVIGFVVIASLCSSLFPFLPSNNFFSSYYNIFYFFIISIYFASKKNDS